MRTIQTAVAIILLLLASAAAIASLDGCNADWNKPHVQVITKDDPCGQDYYPCKDGFCCANGDICRGDGWCAFGGIEGPTWGASRDGGSRQSGYHGLTPAESRKAAPR